MKKIPSTAYVWFDTEFTSLELDEAQLLQVSVLLTDRSLKRITPPEEDLNFYVQLSDDTPVSAWVEKHLSELVAKCRSDIAIPVDEIDQKLTEFIDRWCDTPTKTIKKRPLMAGNSVHNDWILSRKFFPTFTSRLHYRLLDVSTLKVQWLDLTEGEEFDKNDTELVQKYFPEADLSRLRQHDAYFDIVASAAELAYYRDHMTFTA
jgi:oligoribonuclease